MKASNSDKVNYYGVLGVSANAERSDIRKAYFNKMKIHHPDKNLGSPESEERAKLISEAYEILYDSQLRSEFDATYTATPKHDPNAERLSSGFQLSTIFKNAIRNWKKQGAPASDNVSFRPLKTDGKGVYTSYSQADIPLLEYNKLTDKKLPSLKSLLTTVLPEWVWEWKMTAPLPISAEILNSPLWKSDDESVEHLVSFVPRHQRLLEKAQSDRDSLVQTNDSAPLTENKSSEASSNCTICEKDFGFFGFLGNINRHNCATCGKASCSGCMTFHTMAVKPYSMGVCTLCHPKSQSESKAYKFDEWFSCGGNYETSLARDPYVFKLPGDYWGKPVRESQTNCGVCTTTFNFFKKPYACVGCGTTLCGKCFAPPKTYDKFKLPVSVCKPCKETWEKEEAGSLSEIGSFPRVAYFSFTSFDGGLGGQFIGKKGLRAWLNDFLLSLKEDGKDCIPYFKSKIPKENFVVQRDRYLEKGELPQALLCHRLSGSDLSFEDLAKKWQQRDEESSFACYAHFSEKVDGDEFFAQEHYSYALRCYLHLGEHEKIYEKSKILKGESRLLYQKALLDVVPYKSRVIAAICEDLLDAKANRTVLTDVLVASLQEVNKTQNSDDSLIYHKILAKMKMPALVLLGLLGKTKSLCSRPEDVKWHKETLAKIQAKFHRELHQSIQSASFETLYPLLDWINCETIDTVCDLLEKLNIDSLPENSQKSAALMLRACTYQHKKKSNARSLALEDIARAMLIGSSERDACYYYSAKLIEKMSFRIKDSWKLQEWEISCLPSRQKSEFSDRLQRTPELAIITQWEESVEKLEPFDAAMSFIDLASTTPYAVGRAGSALQAAMALFKVQENVNLNLPPREYANEQYAYRQAIGQLLHDACCIGNNLCPSTQVAILRTSLAILNASFGKSALISQHEQQLFVELSNKMNRLLEVFPLFSKQNLGPADLLYHDLVNKEFVEKYLFMRRSLTNADSIYQAYFFQGALHGWIRSSSFEEERQRTMDLLLAKESSTAKDVENLLDFPLIEHQGGWRPEKPTPLNLGKERFSGVQGLRVNEETGQIDFILGTSENPMEQVIDVEDIQETMRMGIDQAFFTLNEPESKIPHHPFQEAIVEPEVLKFTRNYGTLLYADLLLKSLVTGVEVSTEAPFPMRGIDDHLLMCLPEDLRKELIKLREDMFCQGGGEAQRFWIKAGNLPYTVKRSGNEITYWFGECEMSVHTHLLRRDEHGKLVDADEDEDLLADSPEAKFAKFLSKNYKVLDKIFPELARLRQLAILQSQSLILQNVYQRRKEQIASLKAPEENIASFLKEIKQNYVSQIADSNVRSVVDSLLRGKGINPRKIPDLDARKRSIREDIAKREQGEVCKYFKNNFFVTENIENAVLLWLEKGRSHDALLQIAKQSIIQHEREKLLQLCRAFNEVGILTDKPLSSKRVKDLKPAWVPTAYHRKGAYSVHGGVSNTARLVSTAAQNQRNGSGGSSGSAGGSTGSSGSRRGGGGSHINAKWIKGSGYVERMEGSRRYATAKGTVSIGTEKKSGVMIKLLKECYDSYNLAPSETSLRVHYESHLNRVTGIRSITHHPGTYHIHHTSGKSVCTGKTTQVYNETNKKDHRCEKK